MTFDYIEALIIAFSIFIYGSLLMLKISNDPIRLGKVMFIFLIIISLCSFGIYSAVAASS